MNTLHINNPMTRVLSLRNFRLLFAGSATSMLGDQFALIATPWLVLKITGDPTALGLILALEGIPRAAFMLMGGAITDRISPRMMMLLADLLRLGLAAWMAVMVLSGAVEVWMLYVFGLGFGLVAGFAIPAQNSIVPMLVAERDLQAGNSIIMGATQLAGFVGPTIAGILIGGYSNSFVGIGLAFALDAITFAVSAAALWMIRMEHGTDSSRTYPAHESIWTAILEGVRHLWNDSVLRLMFLVLSIVNFLLLGPILVGIPVLANQVLPEGAVAFGILMSAFAGGNLTGYLLAGSLPQPSGPVVRSIVLLLIASFGASVGLLGFITNTWVDFVLLALLGLGNGYLAILLFTWMQTQTPKTMLGRIMSLLMFTSTGLVPISEALAGFLLKLSVPLLFASSGALVMLLALWMSFQPGLQTFCDSLTATSSTAKETSFLLELSE